MRRLVIVFGLVLTALLSLAPTLGAAGERANGTLVDGTGNAIGSVTIEQRANDVRVAITLASADVVKPGLHGLHFHAVGKCDGPDFTSAGGHFNPGGKQHGAKNPAGPHAGDLPNLPIDATTAAPGGGYAFSTATAGVTLAAGATSLFDADGTALVIHANPDDEVTDPTGNSGGRVACAVLTMSQAAPGMPNTGAGGTVRSAFWWQMALLVTVLLAVTAAMVRPARRRA